jgi:pimeloyl-ACP methyl ester carboxylesterase
MQKVLSRDGTALAFDRFGDGPPLILVVGAFNDRATGAPLATFLAPHFRVFNYDRRGRGESGDTAPYAIDREIEDLAALIAEAGGAAAVFGYSSGACLALQAAAHGLPITRLALFEPPYRVGPTGTPPNHAAHLAELIAAGRRGDAVEYFQTEMVGIPPDVVAQFRHAPFRPALEAMAHTLVYEAVILGDGSLPAEMVRAITVPTLAIAGGAGFPFMRVTAQALADTMPNGQAHIMEGQTHDIMPAVLGPVLEAFLAPVEAQSHLRK